ncbi:MAG: alpha/beta hydrolase [Deltaproteobacteria bacterium]|nr:alpha/beta hydrolase [Deltaproteobacteria bacterium]
MIYIYILTILLLLLTAAGYYLSKKSLNPKTWDYKESYQAEVEKGNFDEKWFKNLRGEDVYIDSDEGFRLHGIWYKTEGAEKSVILSHRDSFTLYGSVKYMKMFLDRRFNVLLIDQRYHGLSEGKICTMGHREKIDHVRWVTWIEKRMGQDHVIGTHGESMGASTILMHGAIDDRVKFIIADCPYQSLYDQFRYRLKEEFKLPPFPLLYMTNLFARIRTGAFYKTVSPLEAVKKIKIPVLFIHGNADKSTVPANSINLHKAKGGPGFLYLATDGEHAGSYSADPEKYRKIVYRFLDNSGM